MKKNIYLPYIVRLILLILGIYSGSVMSQKSTVRGFVLEKETGEPVIFTNVILKGTTFGSTTDESGYFNISGVPAGNYELLVTSIGYDSLKMTVTLKAGEIQSHKLQLVSATIKLSSVSITANKEENRTETKISVSRITPTQIKQIPSIGGQADIVQYLQIIPGVVFSGDQGGQLYVRGGPPVQNKVIIDGMTVYNPFHSIGLFSVFETDIIRNIDVYTGGFNSEYGGRISSIMDITTRDGNKRRIAGKIGMNTLNTSGLLEGPLTFRRSKEKDIGSSFVVSVKRAHIDQSSEILYDYIDENGLPYNYLDLYGKIAFYPTALSRINIFGYHYADDVSNFKELSSFKWVSRGIGSNFLIIPGTSQVKIEGSLAYSRYGIEMDEYFNPDRKSHINSVNMGLDFKYFSGKNVFQYGIDLIGGSTYYEYIDAKNAVHDDQDNTTELGIYLKYKKTWNKVLLEPGLRFQWYADLSVLSPEPRLAVKYNLAENFRLKLAAGRYTQNLIAAVSDRDIVNLFYGFLSTVDNLPARFKEKEVRNCLQRADHLIAGAEFDIRKTFLLNIEGYFKDYGQLTNYNREKIYDEGDDIAEGKPDILKKLFVVEDGNAKGVEVSLKADRERYNLYIAYSFAFVERDFENARLQPDGSFLLSVESYNPHFDRRHNLNFVAGYRFGKGYNWETYIRWNYGTGFPFTATQLYYEQIPFSNGILSEYITANGMFAFLYGDWNVARLPTYHRLDVSLKKSFHFSEHQRLDLDLSVINVYNRDNIFYVDRITNKRINQLPVLPGIGLTYTF